MLIKPPIIKKDKRFGSNANHNFFRIKIFTGLKTYLGTLAQELWEWRYSRLIGLAVGVPLAAGVIIATGSIWGAAFAALVANLLGPRLIPPLHRYMELMGHMVETVVARDVYGETFEEYLMKEATVLARYEQFKGWNAQKCYDEMLTHQDKAEKWVKRHKKFLLKEKEKNDNR